MITSVSPVRLLSCGPVAWLLEVDDDSIVSALAEAAGALDEVAEVVPGARTVLVHLAPGADLARSGELLRRLAPAADLTMSSGATVTLGVVYDGEDLGAVAEACGLTADGVVERHTTATYRSAFCGFAPGFAYLSGLDPALHLPRRATPRTSVPAGSVAIADGYSAVYPGASPGGWHLLGRTEAALFDPARDRPALLPPGTIVRFKVA